MNLKAACLAVYLVLCGLIVTAAEDSESVDQVLLRHFVDLESGELNKDTAKLLWIHCRIDLVSMKKAGKDIEIFTPLMKSFHASEINSNFQASQKDDLKNILFGPHCQLKKFFLDCLRKNNVFFPVSGDDGGSKSWLARYLGSFFTLPDSLRWNLRRELLVDTMAPTPAPALAPVPDQVQTPGLAPAPIFNAEGSGSQNPTDRTPPRPAPFFPSLESPPSGSGSSGSDSSVVERKKKGSHRSVVIAVVTTAAVTFAVVSLLFLCCSRLRRSGYGGRKNDERPLLSISLSDYSVNSSPKPFSPGNSVKEDMLGNQTFGANSFYKNNMQDYTMKPPPERVGVTPGLPPLKPPPGRARPLPPEPPASLKPSSFKTRFSPSAGGGPTGQQPAPPMACGAESSPPLPGPLSSGARPPPPSTASMASAARPPVSPSAPMTSDVSPPTRPPASMAASARPAPPPPPPMAPPGPTHPPKGGAPPPPPPKGGVPPPPPPKGGVPPPRPPPFGAKTQSNTSTSQGGQSESEADSSKAKLKPFFWDKVTANPDQSMVWHQIRSGSFQFNEEMIETLFGYASIGKNKSEMKKDSSSQEPNKYVQIIDPKRSHNLSILLRALNVTIEEVHDALLEGSELPVELLQTLLKMAPTADEEMKLRLFNGEVSQLGPAERFLKALVDIPFAFKRLEALLFMCTLQEDVAITKESFATLEVACKELRNSRLFLKLLEAVLKTGNRMNDGTFRGGAQAFKLDTLLKLSDVKGVDGKTTLLHFVVQEIIRSEGIRAARAARESTSAKSDDLFEEIPHVTEEDYRGLGLQVVSSLGSQLENIKKAAVLDADSLSGTVAKLGHATGKTQNFLNTDMKSLGEGKGFYQALTSFVQGAETDVKWLLAEEKRIMALVKSTGDYFHGKEGKNEGLRIFVIVRDFLIMLDKACKEVKEASAKHMKAHKKEAPAAPLSSDTNQPPLDLHRRLFPAIANRRIDYSSSDDENT